MCDDGKLIDCVRQYPVLYSTSHDKYLDVAHKTAIWTTIAEEMDMDVTACKSRWNNIRDTYRKSIKKYAAKYGQDSKKIKLYKYSDKLDFLTGNIGSYEDWEILPKAESKEGDPKEWTTKEEPHFEHTIHDQSSHQDTSVEYEIPETILEESTEPPALPPSRPTQKRSAAKQANQSTTATKLMEYLIAKSENEKSQHPVDIFLAGIATTLKTFSPYHLHLAKAEIFNTVHKYEYETIMEVQRNNTMQNAESHSTSSPSLYMQPHIKEERSTTQQYSFHQFQLNIDKAN